MYIFDMISQKYKYAWFVEGKYRLQTTKTPNFCDASLYASFHTRLLYMCCKCQFWLCLFCWNLEGFEIDTDEVEEKLAVVHSWSICQPSICLSWLPALAVAGPRGVRAFKEGEKMKSNLQSASPKEVRVPAERTKEAASFLRQDQDCIDPVAASQCSHLSKCPESLYLFLIDYLHRIGLNLKPG